MPWQPDCWTITAKISLARAKPESLAPSCSYEAFSLGLRNDKKSYSLYCDHSDQVWSIGCKVLKAGGQQFFHKKCQKNITVNALMNFGIGKPICSVVAAVVLSGLLRLSHLKGALRLHTAGQTSLLASIQGSCRQVTRSRVKGFGLRSPLQSQIPLTS